MFSQIEENYIKALINTYKKQGYKYYLCYTITEPNNNNEYDICLYISKEEIKAINSNTFDLTNAICIQIDSSSRNDNNYNPSTHSRDKIANSNVTNIIEVHQAEFIYTNASYNYNETNICVNPDLLLQGSDSFNTLYLSITCIVVLIVTFLYTFFINILRVRR